MSTIYGIWNYSRKPLDKNKILDFAKKQEQWPIDKQDQWVKNDIVLGNIISYNTKQSFNERVILQNKGSTYVITADARLDNRDDLFLTFNIESSERSSFTDSHLILQAYHKWGSDCCAHLIGAFVFAIWDAKNQKLFLGRDHIGIKRLYYGLTHQTIYFSSESKALVSQSPLTAKLSKSFLLDYLGDQRNSFTTLYEDIKILPPAHNCSVDREGNINLNKYWKPDPYRKIRLKSNQEYVQKGRYLLEQAVECRMNSEYPVGCQLSGGLDSSGIAAIAHNISKQRSNELYTYSNVLAKQCHDKVFPYSDDYLKVKAVLDYTGITNNVRIEKGQLSFREEIEKSIEVFGYPTNIMFGISHRIAAASALDGVRTMLSGFPGDEVVTSTCTGYKRTYYSQRKWWTLAKNLYYDDKYTLKNLKLKRNKKRRVKTKYTSTLLSEALYEKNRHHYQHNELNSRDFNNNMLCRNITSPSIEHRITSESAAAALWNVDMRYPLSDVRLIEFYLACPLEQKANLGMGRYLFRRIMKGLIPEDIRLEKKSEVIVIPHEYIHRSHDYDYYKSYLSGITSTDKYDFINLQLVTRLWDEMLSIKNKEMNIEKVRRPGKVFLAFQLMKMMDLHPNLADNIKECLHS